MALWICEGCTTKYAVGLHRCPRCHSTDFHEEDSMPKISRAAGATNGLPDEAVVETVEPEAPVVEPDVEPETLAPEPEPETASEPEVEPEADPEPAPVKRTRARAAKPAEDTTDTPEPEPEAEE